eukprot:9504098-Pyramimonas_sp.AAC.2
MRYANTSWRRNTARQQRHARRHASEGNESAVADRFAISSPSGYILRTRGVEMVVRLRLSRKTSVSPCMRARGSRHDVQHVVQHL